MNKLPKEVTEYKSGQQKAWRDRKRAAGLTDVTVWVPIAAKDRLLKYAEKIRREYEEEEDQHPTT